MYAKINDFDNKKYPFACLYQSQENACLSKISQKVTVKLMPTHFYPTKKEVLFLHTLLGVIRI